MGGDVLLVPSIEQAHQGCLGCIFGGAKQLATGLFRDDNIDELKIEGGNDSRLPIPYVWYIYLHGP